MLTARVSRIRIVIADLRPDDGPGQWRVGWDITNADEAPVNVSEAWLPHGRFRGEGHVRLNLSIAPGQQARIELRVKCQEPPGTVVKNAFLILRTSVGRVFARMRVEFDESPRPILETVTTQSLQSGADGTLS